MTVATLIEQVKPLINYDFNDAIRQTLFPIDKFIKQALYDALNEIATQVRIIEKSVFVPLVQNYNVLNLTLSSLTKSKFDIASPKSIILKRYDNLIYKFPNRFLEDMIEQTDFLNIYALAFRHLGADTQLISNTNISDVTSTLGTFDSIVTRPTATSITVAATGVAIGSLVVNLDKADVNLYSYRTVTNVVGTTLTLDNTMDSYPIWAVGEKIYICTSLPYMFLFTFQATLLPDYFDTETNIPIQNQYIQDLKHIVVQYLYQVLSIRFPEQAKVYSQALQVGTLLNSAKVISNIKKRLNDTIESPVSKLYQPYTEYYGR